MRRNIFQVVAFKMKQPSAFKTFHMKVIVTLLFIVILIAGAFSLAENEFPDDILFAELFKIAVYGGFADLLSFQRIGYIVCGKMLFAFFLI